MGRAKTTLLLVCALAFPVALWSNRDGADPFKTGGPFPGEGLCVECHAGRPNTGPGSVTFSVSNYRPNEKQKIGRASCRERVYVLV